jgi:hypothetical protein
MESFKNQIVFDAIPSTFISKNPVGSSNKNVKIKNLFYCIYGCYVKSTKEYIVMHQIFKKINKRKDKTFYFKKIEEEILSFKDKTKVMKYISDYLWNFSEHERVSNLMVENKIELTEKNLASIIDSWYIKIIEYFTSLEQLNALNNLAKKNN